jgi:glutaredoxin-like YruB-family protein
MFWRMRNAWLMGLLLFCAVASGWILVQGRAEGEQAELGALLVEQAHEGAQELADDLGLPAAGSEPAREAGAFYRYTDAAGTMRFVGSLAEVPAAFRDSAQAVSNDRVQRAPAGSAGPRARADGNRDPVAPLEERALEHEVVVYTTSWCGWCRKTVKYLTQRGVAFENRDIEAERTWRRELKQKTGSTSVPVVEIDGQIIRGYDPERMAELLRSS